jgi:arginyl-tRNA synthetase
MTLIQEIAEATKTYLAQQYQFEVEEKHLQIDNTRKEFEGDFTLVVFPFVKVMRTAPEKAGEAIGEYLISAIPAVAGFNVIKGFLNLSLSSAYWTNMLGETLNDPTWFSEKEKGGTVLVEYSSPNTNKPLHLGHCRNIFLGDAVAGIKSFAGANVVRTQIINDRGVHICKSMLAWKEFGNGETPESSDLKGDKLVGKYYVKYDQEFKAEVAGLMETGISEEDAKKQSPLAIRVQNMLKDWEAGEPETVALWQMMNNWVYKGFDGTYSRMGVEFDKLYYESNTYKSGKEIAQKGLKKDLFFQKEDGSIWIDLTEDGLDQKLLVRGDGTTVYMTQDIGTAVQRYADFPGLKQVIYTVGDEQDYHFKVLFMILQKLGYNWASACKHLSYGMVDLPSGKMKSREGTVVDADDLMQEVVAAAKASSEEKGKLDGMSEEEQNLLFETLGIGALKFYLLRVDPRKRMMFDPEESVSLNGDTGPFVQYTYARCQAVLRKVEGAFDDDITTELSSKERLLMRSLMDFNKIVKEAAVTLNPALVASYCVDIAKLYNQFYHDFPILKAEGAERNFRVALTRFTSETIKTGMSLLGIGVPPRM